ncbi:MAG: peptidylprolyl isomerase [Anaerolineae bacterium]
MAINRWVLGVSGLFLVLLMVSCGPTATPTPTVEPPTATPQPTVSSSATVSAPSVASRLEMALKYIRRVEGATLATVNGQPITWEEYEPALRQTLLLVNQQHAINWDDPAMQARLWQLQNDVLKQVVDRYLMRNLATEQGIEVDPAQFKAQVEKEKNSILSSGRYPDWETFLRTSGLTEQTFEQVIHDTLLYSLLLSAQKVDTEAEQVRLAHIVVADEATAQEVASRLKGGEDFATLAAQYSLDDQTKNSGGDLGWFTQEMMAPEIGGIAFSLSVGQFSEPISTQRGYAIIKVLERGLHELEDQALRVRQQEALKGQIEAERAKATIKYLVDFQGESSP